MSDNLELTKKIKEIECIKSDIVSISADIIKKTAMGATYREVGDSIAALILKAYFLGDSLGISFAATDLAAIEAIKCSDSTESSAALYRHLSGRKG